MAVSMNSGFMRSDFMISDAALPVRMDELELEQLSQEATFSDILGDIGSAPVQDAAVPQNENMAEQAVPPSETEAMPKELSSSEMKALARAVALGKIKLDEIPEEYVTDVLMMVIAMMMQDIPEDEIPLPEDYSEREIKPVRIDVKTAESFLEQAKQNSDIGELVKLVTEASGIEIPEDMKLALKAKVKTVELSTELGTQAVEQAAEMAETHAVNPQPAVQEEVMSAEAVTANPTAGEAIAAEPITVEAVTSEHRTAQAEGRQNAVQTAATEQTKVTEEFEQLRKVVSEFTVKKSEPEQPAQQSYTAQTMGTESAAKSRVVSKSDELEMLKGMKPAEAEPEAVIKVGAQQKSENGAQTEANAGGSQLPTEQMPQNVNADVPVVFTRSDGSQVEVKPSEVIRQITTTVVEQSTTAEGDTEYSITLNPEDLGSITVKLTKTVDGAMTVSITADNARTQRLIEQSGAALQESLKQNGIQLENWQTVNQSQQQARAQDYANSQRNPQYDGGDNQSDDEDEDGESFAELISAM